MAQPNLLQNAFSAEDFRKQGHALVDMLANHLAEGAAKERKTIPWQEPDDALDFWQQDFEEGTTDDPLSIFTKIADKSTQLHNPRYMGHQVSVSLPMASLGGLVSDVLGNGMAVYEMGLVANPLERIVTDWLCQKIGYDSDATGFLTSGGTLANLTALLAARAAKAPDDVWENGSQNQLAVMVSEQAHYCIDRAARIMGWGTEGVIKIPVNEAFQMKTELLETAFQTAKEKGIQVIAVVGSACSTATGSYDNLEHISAFCQKHNLWFHADGAHGGVTVLSEKYNFLTKGIEKADSVIVDFHKMMMIPALATGVFFKKQDDSYNTFQQKAQYLWANQSSRDWYNSGKRTFECTKYMMCVKIYTVLRTYGEQIFTENVEYLYDLGKQFATMIRNNSAFELAIEPQSNIVCFRYIEGVEKENMSEFNQNLRRLMLEDGRFYIVQTALNEIVYLRVSLMNPLTTEAELLELLAILTEKAATLKAKIKPLVLG